MHQLNIENLHVTSFSIKNLIYLFHINCHIGLISCRFHNAIYKQITMSFYGTCRLLL